MIEGDRPADCFKQFRQHLSDVVSKLLSNVPPLIVATSPNAHRGMLSFANPGTMRLASAYGDLELYLGQELEAYERPDSDKRYTLRTCAYWYRLYPRDAVDRTELFRWEYDRTRRPEKDEHCRNHLHVHTSIPLPGGILELKKVHLPTGWVTIEEVLRFLFKDLEVKPADENWAHELADSERAFRERFSPWGPPAAG